MTDPRHTCPCGGLPAGTPLQECCGPALDGHLWPATAEALMRSRYTAYALGHEDHVFRTWRPRTRPAQVAMNPTTTWLGLTILDVVDGTAEDSEGVVEFVARYQDRAGPEELHERSLFSRRAGRWFYDGPYQEEHHA